MRIWLRIGGQIQIDHATLDRPVFVEATECAQESPRETRAVKRSLGFVRLSRNLQRRTI